jgi:hypothetical protein
MKKITFILLMMLGIVISYGKDKKPKYEIEDDTVYFDKKSIFILESLKKSKFDSKDYYLKDLQGNKLALIQSDCYTDPTRPTTVDRSKFPSSPPYLTSCYNTITFLNSKKVADFSYHYKQVKLAEFLVECGLVKNGTISQVDEDEFILINGNKNAEEKAQKLGRNTIIINNTAPARNGVNIRF